MMVDLMTDGGWAAFLTGTALKGAAVLTMAGWGALLMRRGPAAGRHWVWLLGLVGTLILPLAALVTPRWMVEVPARQRARGVEAPAAPVLPEGSLPASAAAWARGGAASTGAGHAVGAAPSGTPIRIDRPRRETPAFGQVPGRSVAPPDPGRSLPAATAGIPVGAAPLAELGSGPVEGVAVPPPMIPPTRRPLTAELADVFGRLPWAPIVFLVWLGGALALLGRLAASHVALLRLQRSATPVTSRRVRFAADSLAGRMGVQRPVALLEGGPDTMPMSWGLVHPRIVLPARAEEWPASRLESVLLHELAHVRRRDCLSQLVAEIAVAMHWLNPLAWIAAHRLRVEREHACDDAVLVHGAPASGYASELIALARELRTPQPAAPVAVAMLGPAHLRERIRAVLDADRPRAMGRVPALVSAAVAMTGVLLLATVTPVRAGTRSGVPTIGEAPSFAIAIADASPSHDASDAEGLAPVGSPTSSANVSVAGSPAPHGVGHAPEVLAPSVADVPTRGPGPGPLARRARSVLPTLQAASFALLDVASRPTTRLLSPQAATCGMATDGWERSSSQTKDGDRYRLEWSRDGCSVDVRIEGRVTFAGDFSGVAQLERRGFVRIEEDDDGTRRWLEIRPDESGRPAFEYRLNGADHDFDAAARAWYEGMMLQVFRRAGFMAQERVASMLRTGGVQSVLDELDMLTSDHVFSLYARELIEQADLSEDQAVSVVERARRRVDSDHYMTEILLAVADRHLDSDRGMDAFLEAAATLESDHYRAQVLGHALEQRHLDSEQVTALIGEVVEMDSDHYISEVLRAVAGRYFLDEGMRDMYLRAVSMVESDHYKAEILGALLDRNDLDQEQVEVVLQAVADMESAHYQTELLLRIVGDVQSERGLESYLAVVASMDSDHYRTESLQQLVERDLPEPLVVGVVRTAASMESDHYKTLILMQIADRWGSEDGPVRDALVGAMNTMESGHYRGQLAEALLRRG